MDAPSPSTSCLWAEQKCSFYKSTWSGYKGLQGYSIYPSDVCVRWLALCMRIFATLSHLKRDQDGGGSSGSWELASATWSGGRRGDFGMDQGWAGKECKLRKDLASMAVKMSSRWEISSYFLGSLSWQSIYLISVTLLERSEKDLFILSRWDLASFVLIRSSEC